MAVGVRSARGSRTDTEHFRSTMKGFDLGRFNQNYRGNKSTYYGVVIADRQNIIGSFILAAISAQVLVPFRAVHIEPGCLPHQRPLPQRQGHFVGGGPVHFSVIPQRRRHRS